MLGITTGYLRQLLSEHASDLGPIVRGRDGWHPRPRRLLSDSDLKALYALLMHIRAVEKARRDARRADRVKP